MLLGAVGGPKWDTLPGHLRPEKGLLGIRATLGLYANLRPATLHKALQNACPLRPEVIDGGLDLLFVRELTGGIYFGERGRWQTEDGETAFDTERYSVKEIERVGRKAFALAQGRRNKLCSADKANVYWKPPVCGGKRCTVCAGNTPLWTTPTCCCEFR